MGGIVGERVRERETGGVEVEERQEGGKIDNGRGSQNIEK